MKNILLIGGGRGIGLEIALNLVQNPLHHVFVVSKTQSHLATLVKLKNEENYPGQLTVLQEDISTISKRFTEFLSQIQSIDILINNAAVLINKPFIDTSIDDWKSVFDTNLFGIVSVIKECYPFLGNTNNSSHIVNIGSMGGFQGSKKFQGLTAYSSSKAALANLTEVLAEEFVAIGKNVKVNCLALGAVDTEMLHEAFPTYKTSMTAKEMAKYIVWFACNGSDFQNGKTIPVSLSTP